MKLASYACNQAESKGRLHKESYHSNRLTYQKDHERLIHCVAFRRLEYKTQVFMNHVGDHYRNRLTHSLEVAQVARMISSHLCLNEDLSEVIALAHDIGHPPFGHAGEDALNLVVKKYGGFDHNAHAMEIITALENRYIEFNGINLSWEALEGIAKHNGPLVDKKNKYGSLHPIFKQIDQSFELHLDKFASLEAQVAALADDIAYCNHDIDDGLRAGFIQFDDLLELEYVGDIFAEMKSKYSNYPLPQIINESIRRLRNNMIDDLVVQTEKNINQHSIKTAQDVRDCGTTLVTFSPQIEQVKNKLKAFLMQRVYRHYQVNRMAKKASQIISELFNIFMESPECLPNSWQKKFKNAGKLERATSIKHYIAGMTDRYAIEEHKKITDLHKNFIY